MKLFALFSIVMLAVPVRPALSAAVPDSAALFRLRERASTARQVRVTTARASWFLTKPTIDSTGVLSVSATRPIFGQAEGRRITWDQIRSLHAHDHDATSGAVVGAAIGAGAGFLLALAITQGLNVGGGEGGYVIFPVAATVGGFLGLTIGAATTPRDERIYP